MYPYQRFAKDTHTTYMPQLLSNLQFHKATLMLRQATLIMIKFTLTVAQEGTSENLAPRFYTAASMTSPTSAAFSTCTKLLTRQYLDAARWELDRSTSSIDNDKQVRSGKGGLTLLVC